MRIEPQQMLDRAKRAFGGDPTTRVLARYRAVVGPVRSQEVLVVEAFNKLQNGTVPSPAELAALEFAIRAFRPSVLCREGRLGALPPEAIGAFPDWQGFAKCVSPFLYSIGRIDHGAPVGKIAADIVGTGFLISKALLLTNCHVVDILSQGYRLLERGQAVVRFGQEYATIPDQTPVPISHVVAVHDKLDIAVLRMDDGSATDDRTPLELEAALPSTNEPLVVIGYPFPDNERNPYFASVVFGDQHYGVKRAAPGETLAAEDQTIFHDCSTLGGNSGSPVLSMRTGRVVGLHRKGDLAIRNEAIACNALRDFLANVA